ncbi:hypothetical protein [Flagellimonas olearia]|uniref:Alpha/beta hydrolase n=1 Tax=Flagellimonas olearia TaxID=552546 RepID=A0A444VRG0_9FLAO|nr:hypothetical protein [Allomuricauda olearia]RYC53296.1 hypothetical protein DN53_03485 [Allomuricauda olearia]
MNTYVTFRSQVISLGLVGMLMLGCATPKKEVVPQMRQAPSPMQDHIREHARLKNEEPPGTKKVLEGILSKPVTVYMPPAANGVQELDLLIHFHGAPFVAMQAVHALKKPMALAVVQQGSGSSVYAAPFVDVDVYPRLLKAIQEKLGVDRIGKVYFSSFSAGYGAVRELLKAHEAKIDGILLLDGLHTDYIPDSTPLAQGGQLNAEKMKGFLAFAQKAVNGEKKMLVTHSEIFPGTYASTTETADWLIHELGLQRNPILEWGPMGMQQVSETQKGNFSVKAFVGNTAPDHVDHLHGITAFVKAIMD